MSSPMLKRPFLLSFVLAAAAWACGSAEDVNVEPVSEGELGEAPAQDPNALIDSPFYFGVPKSVVTTPLERAKYTYPTLWNPSSNAPDVGLRIIAVEQAGTAPAQKRVARVDMAKQLARAGVLRDGDVAITFRPELAKSKAYPHLQMGLTHASLVYTKNGEAFNIDVPLDDVHVGQFNAPHFVGNGTPKDLGLDALQIVRPRNMNDTRRAQFRDWVSRVMAKRQEIRAQVPFQDNYLVPAFAPLPPDPAGTGPAARGREARTTKQTVTELGKIILRKDTSSKLGMYCSEFAWHMLALSNCSPAQIESAGVEGAECVDPVFAPMPLVTTPAGGIGLADGPFVGVSSLPDKERQKAGILEVFPEVEGPGAARLSPGHRATSSELEQKGIIGTLRGVYFGRLGIEAPGGGAAPPVEAAIGGLNESIPPNYSPTAFLVQSLPAEGRKLDYVATVVFTNASGMKRARELAKKPVP